jgi:lysophospholipase L1-like esterase
MAPGASSDSAELVSRRGPFERYVAIGDSSTEGLNDPDGAGGYRGWANRLAEHVARAQGRLLYANLARRGLRTRQILEQQLEPALEMRPDLATVFSGTNDVVRRGYDSTSVALGIERIQTRLIEQGATVLTFTLPDLTAVMPVGRLVRHRVESLNSTLREISSGTGAILVDFAAHSVASDPRLWSDDRLHANSAGHERIAAALANALGLPGAGDEWQCPLPAEPRRSAAARFATEAGWWASHLLPWIGRRLLGRSSGDGVSAKRPRLEPVEL